MLSQYIKSDNYNILAVYYKANTKILGKDSSGTILKIINGLKIIKVATQKGSLQWSY